MITIYKKIVKNKKATKKKVRKDLKRIYKSLESFSDDSSDMLSVQKIRNRQIVMEQEIFGILAKYKLRMD
jgi:hypothetical protein